MPRTRKEDRRRFWHQAETRFGVAMIVVMSVFAFWLASVFG
jgi:hypothetical protein